MARAGSGMLQSDSAQTTVSNEESPNGRWAASALCRSALRSSSAACCSFSLMESVEILREILTRYDIAPRDADEDKLRPHSIINAPHRGTRLVVSRR